VRNRSSRLLPLLGAAVFVGFYIVNDLVRSAVATSPLPLPNAPDDDIYRYVTGEPLAVGLPAAAHLLSSAGLLMFVLASRQVEPRRAGDLADWWSCLAGLVAVAALTASAALSITLAVAVALPAGVVLGLNQAAFVTGGTLHVASLGVYIALTGRTYAERSVRGLAWVAAVPAVLSLISLVWFYGTALILLGRLLSMAWLVLAGVALTRVRRPSPVPAVAPTEGRT
jgi:hypothetical protein